jgi:Fe-S-cluster containining protein
MEKPMQQRTGAEIAAAENRAITDCIRCATCCKKGGPAFHRQDKELLTSGRIKTTAVFTIREGEPVFDNISGDLIAAPTDIIKIKGQADGWTCRFLGVDEKTCTVYDNRPFECRIMRCWDTTEIEAAYNEQRLTREDLLAGVEGLWDFIGEHQAECSYDTVRRLLTEGGGRLTGPAVEVVLQMIKYDLAVRPMVIEKGQLDREWIEFLLGRPLIETITLFGLEVVKEGEDYDIRPISIDQG